MGAACCCGARLSRNERAYVNVSQPASESPWPLNYKPSAGEKTQFHQDMAQYYTAMAARTTDGLIAYYFTEQAQFHKRQLPAGVLPHDVPPPTHVPPQDGPPPTYEDTRLRNRIEMVLER